MSYIKKSKEIRNQIVFETVEKAKNAGLTYYEVEKIAAAIKELARQQPLEPGAPKNEDLPFVWTD